MAIEGAFEIDLVPASNNRYRTTGPATRGSDGLNASPALSGREAYCPLRDQGGTTPLLRAYAIIWPRCSWTWLASRMHTPR